MMEIFQFEIRVYAVIELTILQVNMWHERKSLKFILYENMPIQIYWKFYHQKNLCCIAELRTKMYTL